MSNVHRERLLAPDSVWETIEDLAQTDALTASFIQRLDTGRGDTTLLVLLHLTVVSAYCMALRNVLTCSGPIHPIRNGPIAILGEKS